MDFTELSELLAAHKWLAVVALVITAVVRLLKSDTPIPITIPAQWRAWLALGLGTAAGVLDAIVGGSSPLQAILQGLAAAALAITAHDTIVEGLRGGRDWFAKKPASSSSGGAASGSGTGTTGSAVGIVLAVGLAALVVGPPACSPANRDAVKKAVDIASVACVLLRGAVTDGQVQEVCATEAELAPLVKDLVVARARPSVRADGGVTVPAPEPLRCQ